MSDNFIIYIKNILLLVTLVVSSACNSSDQWDGVYTYSSTYGKTVGGSVVTSKYRLNVRSSLCDLNIEGYQINDTIKCTVDNKASSMSVKFKSYGNGDVVNEYGVAMYKVDDVLFSLSKKDDLLVTTWGREKPDNIPTNEGTYFKLK